MMKAYTKVIAGGRGLGEYRAVEVFGCSDGVCLIKDGGVAGEIRRELVYVGEDGPRRRIRTSDVLSSRDPEPPPSRSYPWQTLGINYIDIIEMAVDRVVNRGT